MRFYGSTSTLTKALSQIYFHISGEFRSGKGVVLGSSGDADKIRKQAAGPSAWISSVRLSPTR